MRKVPPKLSPSDFARSMAFFMAMVVFASGQRISDSSMSSGLCSAASAIVSSGMAATPTDTTYDITSTPSAARNSRATPAAATRAAVSRALARSKMLRQSSVFVRRAPTRSACPGRGVTSRTKSRGASPKAAIRSVQFSQSRLATSSAMGLPMVRPKRMPLVTRTVSFSMTMRPPRP